MKENIEEIAQGLYRISIPLSFGLDCVHAYALVEDGRVALFDAGPDMGEPSLTIYQSILGRIGLSLKDIDRIFLTHAHVDHCGFAGRIKDISGAIVYMSQIEFDATQRAQTDRNRTDAIAAVWRQHGEEEKVIKWVGNVLAAFTMATAPFIADHFLLDAELIRFGKWDIRVISTPGHTRGHVCFLLPAEQYLIAGDCILPDITPNLSPDLYCPSFLPLESFISSLERIAALDVRRVYPAHGEPFDKLKERAAEIIVHHEKRKEVTRQLVNRNPQTAAEISRKLFGEALPSFDKGLALSETCVHLMQLEKEGQVEKTQESGRIFFKRIYSEACK